MRAVAVGLVVAALVGFPVRAAEDAGFAFERFTPALTRDGIINVESAQVGQHFDYDLGLHVGYELNPLVLYQNGQRVDALVGHRVHGNLIGALALFEWVQVGLDLPLVMFQTREAGSFGQVLGTVSSVSAVGLGDLRLAPKIRVLRAQDQGVELAVTLGATIPTGFPAQSYLGDGRFSFIPELEVGRTLGPVRLGANVGYRLREAHQVLDIVVGPELYYRAGAGVDLARAIKLPLEADVSFAGATSGTAPFVAGINQSPLEALLGVTTPVWGPLELQAYVGAGLIGGFGAPDFRAGVLLRASGRDRDADNDGIEDSADGCPNAPEHVDGFEDADGCPDPDNDSDGVLDADDACVNVAGLAAQKGCPRPDTDRDGLFDDEDACVNAPGTVATKGCPDTDGDGIVDTEDACVADEGPWESKGCPDRDKDRVPDNVDRCPDDPETINGDRDDDGCPEKTAKVNLTREKIEILDKVYFDTAKATIQARSFALLDQVAAVLAAHPEIKHVRVEGHTDDKGNDASNLTLSSNRAKSVVAYLVKKNVDPAVLEGVGYGEARPVAENTTAPGREKNRRVEFVIVGDGSGAVRTDAGSADTQGKAPGSGHPLLLTVAPPPSKGLRS